MPIAEDKENNIPLAGLPSKNYETAKGTLVYRLSELVFGSLLAAYILGFTTFAAQTITQTNATPLIDFFQSTADSKWLTVLTGLDVVRFAAISTTYAYLTAAFYFRYHIVILTMPTAAVERSALDFTIAVSQGILFGISMVVPHLHFLCVAIMLGVAIFRQDTEFRELAEEFAEQVRGKIVPTTPTPMSSVQIAKSKKKLGDAVKNIITTSEVLVYRVSRHS